MDMLKIVRNTTNIAELKDQKYVFCTRDFGGPKPYYGKIGLTAFIGYFQNLWEYMKWKKRRGS